MNANTKSFFVTGPAGQLECALDTPQDAPVGIALLAHPHPLYGGRMDNKVVQIMTRAFVELGYAVARMNFRGVGRSQGAHNGGIGEADDLAIVLKHVQQIYPGLPFVLGGYSFGTYVQSILQQKLLSDGIQPERMVLVSATAGKWALSNVPENTLLIHGENDDIIPLDDLFEWARPQDLSIVVVTGADHLFNRKLHHIQNIIIKNWYD